MKEPPAKTFAHMLHCDLYRVPSTFIACLECAAATERIVMRSDLRARMRQLLQRAHFG